MNSYLRLKPANNCSDALAAARRTRSLPDKIRKLCGGLLVSHASANETGQVVRALAKLYEENGLARPALSCAWFLGDTNLERHLLDGVPALDRGLTLKMWAFREAEHGPDYTTKAAEQFEAGDRLALAAIAHEEAKAFAKARQLWARLGRSLDASANPYQAGLIHFNVARCCLELNERAAARNATVSAVHRLEEAADRYESAGQRERAFDCFHVLIEIGTLTRTFEHVLEGAVNATRILAEDNLKYHALRLQAHTISLAEQSKEYAAAATLAKEMSQAANHHGLYPIARGALLKQGRLWERVAEQIQAQHGSNQLVENALLAALLSFAELGQYSEVSLLYTKLAETSSEDSRQRHYRRASERTRGHTDPPTLARGQLGEHVGPPDLWRVDLVEWEAQGSPSEACAGLLADPNLAGDLLSLRSLLLARLVALAQEEHGEASDEAEIAVAQRLADVALYETLSPLENLYSDGSTEVKLAVIQALSRHLYKRSFVTLEQAVAEPELVSASAKTIRSLRFDHAFEPLARIYQSAAHEQARLAALASLAHVQVEEAVELLLGVLEYGGPKERREIIENLRASSNRRALDLMRDHLPQAKGEFRASLLKVLGAG